jgi:hypothetical protein
VRAPEKRVSHVLFRSAYLTIYKWWINRVIAANGASWQLAKCQSVPAQEQYIQVTPFKARQSIFSKERHA